MSLAPFFFFYLSPPNRKLETNWKARLRETVQEPGPLEGERMRAGTGNRENQVHVSEHKTGEPKKKKTQTGPWQAVISGLTSRWQYNGAFFQKPAVDWFKVNQPGVLIEVGQTLRAKTSCFILTCQLCPAVTSVHLFDLFLTFLLYILLQYIPNLDLN